MSGALWIGGRSAMKIADGSSAVDLWLDAAADVAVGAHVYEVDVVPDALGKVLEATCLAPLSGPRRRPQRVRVATAALAAEIERVGGNAGIVIEIAPTPEIDRLMRSFHTHTAASAQVVPIRREAAAPSQRPGRNDACWCGSGKKYKKCHLDQDASSGPARQPSAPPGRSRWSAVLERMYPRVLDWALANVQWAREHFNFLSDCIEAQDLQLSHGLFALGAFGRSAPSLGEAFRAARGASLDDMERRWLDANIESAWTSYWTVVDTDPGRSLTLRDLFSEEVRTVIEASASRMAVAHDIVCARVVTVDDESYMDIAHPRILGPREAQVLRTEVAGQLALTKRKAVPLEKLRAPKVVLGLIESWESVVHDIDDAPPPTLLNTDGEPLVLVTERFPLNATTAAVSPRLDELPCVTRQDRGAAWMLSRVGNAKHKSWESTAIARFAIEGRALVVETNSRERADAVSQLLVSALGAMLGRGERSERSGQELLEEARANEAKSGGPTLVEVPSLDEQAIVSEFKRRTYASWPDEPLPALGGKTAHAAVKTTTGRKAVMALIDGFERNESRQPPGTRYDFDELRRALGLIDAP